MLEALLIVLELVDVLVVADLHIIRVVVDLQVRSYKVARAKVFRFKLKS